MLQLCWNWGLSREEAGNSALENLLLLWPSSSTLAAYIGNFPAFCREENVPQWHPVLWDVRAVAMLGTSSRKGAQVQALTSWVGLTRTAVLPASSTVCQQKSTAGVLDGWSLTLTIPYSYGVNQHFASSLLLCSPDSIALEIKGDNHLSMSYFLQSGRPTSWAQVRGSWSINSLCFCTLLQPFPPNKVALGWGSIFVTAHVTKAML